MRTLILVIVLASSARAQCELNELFSGDPDAGDGFGASLSLSGDRLLVGAPMDQTGGPGAGAAYLFERQGTSWTQIAVWTGRVGDALGTSVALEGDRGVIGAPLREYSPGDAQEDDSGGVIIIDRQADGTWTETVIAPNFSHLGAVVTLNGDRFAARAFDTVIFFYELQSGTWGLTGSMSEFNPLGGFGAALAWEGSRIVIGAPEPQGPVGSGSSQSGDVLIRTEVGGTWVFEQQLTLPGDTQVDKFGCSLALEGALLVVGAERQGPSGSAYVYRKQVSWFQIAHLEPAVAVPGANFGRSVAVSGSRVAVGAPDVGPGRVYLFEELVGQWIQTGLYSPADSAVGDGFGTSVVVAERLLVGAPRDDTACGAPGCNAGSTYEIAMPPDCVVLGTPFCMGTGCPCGNDDPSAGCVSSTGQGASLTATGSSSVSNDDLTLVATGCPAGNSGLYFMGSSVLAPVFVGDGLACTGGLFRFFPSVVSASGELTLANTASSAPASQIHAGDSRHFQAWTRDVLCGPPPAPCATPCGGGSNLSNAMTIVFTP